MGQMPSTRWLLPLPFLFLLKLVRLLNPPPPDTSTISQLPPELLFRIASFLPPTSAGAFALCSKRLYALLATPYLKCRRGHPSFKPYEILKLLEPGLPNHVACYHCEKLHAIKSAKRHIMCDKRCDMMASEVMRSYIHPSFSYVVFQMVMKRHRQGLPYTSLLNLLSYKHSFSDMNKSGQTDASCRVVDGSLLFRQQHRFIVHRYNYLSLIPDMKTMICPHAKELYAVTEYTASHTPTHKMVHTPGSVDVDRSPTVAGCDSCAHRSQRDEGNWSGLIRCRGCATEFRVDAFATVNGGRAFVLNRWKDLGEGRGVEDPVWQAHLREGGVVPEGRKEGTSICERFEGSGWQGGLESLVTPKEMKRMMNYRCGIYT